MAREKKLVIVNFGGAGLLERSASITFIKYLFVQTDFMCVGVCHGRSMYKRR